MIDPLASALDGIAHADLRSTPWAFLAGLSTSIGPCGAPRYLALGTLLSTSSQPRMLIVGTYLLGLVGTYTCLCVGAGFLAQVLAHTVLLHLLFASVLVISAGTVLWVEPDHSHQPPEARGSASFFLGCIGGCTLSPCCSPIVLAFASLNLNERDPIAAGMLAGAFVVGHLALLVLIPVTQNTCLKRLRLGDRVGGFFPRGSAATCTGTLTLALAAYYGLTA